MEVLSFSHVCPPLSLSFCPAQSGSPQAAHNGPLMCMWKRRLEIEAPVWGVLEVTGPCAVLEVLLAGLLAVSVGPCARVCSGCSDRGTWGGRSWVVPAPGFTLRTECRAARDNTGVWAGERLSGCPAFQTAKRVLQPPPAESPFSSPLWFPRRQVITLARGPDQPAGDVAFTGVAAEPPSSPGPASLPSPHPDSPGLTRDRAHLLLPAPPWTKAGLQARGLRPTASGARQGPV